LLEEKKRVKNELKRYDTSFNNEYKRFPDRKEKEPMRPLYLYYKRLKQAISRAPKQDANYENLNQPDKGQIQKNEKPGGLTNPGPGGPGYNEKVLSGLTSNVQSTAGSSKGPPGGTMAEQKSELERLRKVRGELRIKLENYQDEFMRNHNRKIRYRQDIIPVENDYNYYKKLKIQIKDLEDKVGDGEKKK